MNKTNDEQMLQTFRSVGQEVTVFIIIAVFFNRKGQCISIAIFTMCLYKTVAVLFNKIYNKIIFF